MHGPDKRHAMAMTEKDSLRVSREKVWRCVFVVLLYAGGMCLSPADARVVRSKRSVATYPTTCTDAYRAQEAHTMCLPANPTLVTSGVSQADRQHIVDIHNERRRAVVPVAADMQTMIWNDKLAEVAQQWASQCIYKHDIINKLTEYDELMGQNIVAGLTNWTEVIDYWFKERELYTYGVYTDTYLGDDGWMLIGHYTQMVLNTSSIVGCGYAECSPNAQRLYFVCNYLSGQGVRLQAPYTQGGACGACPGHCHNSLCDCSGLYCFHGGTIDITTCTCVCRSPYTGPDCMNLSCPAEDKPLCNLLWSRDECDESVVTLDCPYMCDLCKGVCEQLGDDGDDSAECATKGGLFHCADCENVNIRTVYCPIMCGVCTGHG